MTRISTAELRAHAGQPVRLAGWMHRLRRLSRRAFLVLRDSKGTAQVVIEEPRALDRLAGLHHESVIEGLPLPHAASRRLRRWPRAVGRRSRGRRQHP